jgi:nucleoredoxin
LKYRFLFRCPPCRAFTPLLSELYQEYHDEKNLKIIFISSDHDQKSFNDYYRTMPWLALDYKERRKREELFRKFNVTSIPKLVLIDGDSGEIISTNAKEQILYLDAEGQNFPWRSKY